MFDSPAAAGALDHQAAQKDKPDGLATDCAQCIVRAQWGQGEREVMEIRQGPRPPRFGPQSQIYDHAA